MTWLQLRPSVKNVVFFNLLTWFQREPRLRNTPLLPCFQSTANRDAPGRNYHWRSPSSTPQLLSSFQTPSSLCSKANLHPESPSPGQSPSIPVPVSVIHGTPFHSHRYPNIGDECYKPVPVSLCIQVSFSTFSVRKPTLGEIWKPIREVTEKRKLRLDLHFQFPSLCPVTICLPRRQVQKYIFKGIQNIDYIFKHMDS